MRWWWLVVVKKGSSDLEAAQTWIRSGEKEEEIERVGDVGTVIKIGDGCDSSG